MGDSDTASMNPLQDARLKLRGELEAPPALRRFGSGWISGVLGIVLGLAGLLLVLALRAPGQFTMPETRALLASPGFRIGLHLVLILAFALGTISLVLRPSKILGLFALCATLLAALLGGSDSTALTPDPTPVFLGLDFFVLRILFTGFLFVPLERMFAQWTRQPIFRHEWREDLFYFLVSSLMVQMLTYLAFIPAKSILVVAPLVQARAWVGALPFVVQFIAIMFLTDLVQYWVHRMFHRVPALWKFHAVHHSAPCMDWMAGARMHFFEILVLRGAWLQRAGEYPKSLLENRGDGTFEDVTAAAGIARSAYGMGGQKCSALSRLYVHEKVADTLLEKIEKEIDRIKIGDPTERATGLGPVVNERAHESYARYVADLRARGAKLRRGGRQPSEGDFARGYYVEPVLAEADLSDPLWKHEMFLPILMVHRYRDRDEAMRLANDTDMGLTAGFFGSKDEIPWFQENIQAGVIYANRGAGATTGAWPGYQPFGGWKGSGSSGKAIASAYYLPLYLREQSRTVVD